MSNVLGLLRRAARALAAIVLNGAPLLALDGVLVRSDTGAPVAGAEISIVGRSGVGITGPDGRFTRTPDPAPPFEVLVTGAAVRIMRRF